MWLQIKSGAEKTEQRQFGLFVTPAAELYDSHWYESWKYQVMQCMKGIENRKTYSAVLKNSSQFLQISINS